MRRRRRKSSRVALAGLLALGGTVLYQGVNGCGTFVAESALAAIDFCSILDCQGGLLGGIIRPCGSPASAADDFLADCRNFETTGGN